MPPSDSPLTVVANDVGTSSTGTFVSFPGSPFELFQPYPPAGDQPEAINKLVEGLNDGETFQTLLGVTALARPSPWPM